MAEEEKNPCGGAAEEATVQTETVAKEKGRGRETISASAAVVREKLCRRCKETFDAASNTATSCRFHPSFFVCRRHDDQKRYYELGPDDPPYAAKFYDCCGAEDPDAQGCTADFHISYDDD